MSRIYTLKEVRDIADETLKNDFEQAWVTLGGLKKYLKKKDLWVKEHYKRIDKDMYEKRY